MQICGRGRGFVVGLLRTNLCLDWPFGKGCLNQASTPYQDRDYGERSYATFTYSRVEKLSPSRPETKHAQVGSGSSRLHGIEDILKC